MRNVVLYLSLLLFSATVKAQMLGTYSLTKGLDYQGVQLTDSGFVETKAHTLNHGGFLTKGTYQLMGDTLILTGTPWEGKESFMEIIHKRDSSRSSIGKSKKYKESYLFLKLDIVDEEGEPGKLAYVVLYNKNSEPIATFFADQEGQFQFMNSKGQVDKISVFTFGTRPLILKMAEWQGYDSHLKVVLKHHDWNSYNSKPFLKKYLYNAQDSTLTSIAHPDSVVVLKYKTPNAN